jgi:ribosomal protein S6
MPERRPGEEERLNRYEGLFILPDRLREEELEGALKSVRGEIERLGGTVVSSTRLGRRPFARMLKKTDHGHYVVMVVDLDTAQVPALHARCKLNENVFRLQLVRQKEKAAPATEAPHG